MKCDKLKAEPMIINDDYTALYYPKDSVDAAIDELKREHHRERHEYIEMVAQHKAKLVEQESENRKLKRALYKACANWAILKACLLDYFHIKLNAKKLWRSKKPKESVTTTAWLKGGARWNASAGPKRRSTNERTEIVKRSVQIRQVGPVFQGRRNQQVQRNICLVCS